MEKENSTSVDAKDNEDVEIATHAGNEASGNVSLITPVIAAISVGFAAFTGFFLTQEGPPNDSSRGVIEKSEPMAEDNSSGSSDTIVKPGIEEALGEASQPATRGGGFGKSGLEDGAPPLDPEIVVKFAKHPEVEAICKAYWTDKTKAYELFEAWKSGREHLQDLRLKRATYSNELVLELEKPLADRSPLAIRRAYRHATEKLKSARDVLYAEPNTTAQPGGYN